MMNAFDRTLSQTTEEWRTPVIAVADTMFIMKHWFEDNGIAFTAADLVDVTKLVIEHKILTDERRENDND